MQLLLRTSKITKREMEMSEVIAASQMRRIDLEGFEIAISALGGKPRFALRESKQYPKIGTSRLLGLHLLKLAQSKVVFLLA